MNNSGHFYPLTLTGEGEIKYVDSRSRVTSVDLFISFALGVC